MQPQSKQSRDATMKIKRNHCHGLFVVLALLASSFSSFTNQHFVSAHSGRRLIGDQAAPYPQRGIESRSLEIASNQLGATTSGARSAFPMTPFGDTFEMFNLFSLRSRRDNSDKVKENTNPHQLTGNQEDREGLASRGFYFERLFGSSDEYSEQLADDKKQAPNSTQNQSPTFSDEKLAKDNNASTREPLNPVIMIPGYGGSQLEARLDKPSVVRYFCDHKSDWSDVWINVKLLLPYMIDCLIDNLRLELDYATNTTRNTAGVEVRVKNASSTSSVEFLNSLQISGFAYFAPIVNLLVDQLGFEREMNIRGAPYDFRKAPNELSDYFNELKTTSELLFEANHKQPVTYICHSMGCNNMLYFLQRQPKSWKDQYVRRLISIAAPWGGSLSAMRAAALGDDLGMPYLFSGSKLIRVQRSLPSTIFLFPHKQVFSDAPLIKSNVDPTTYSSSSSSSTPKPTISGARDARLTNLTRASERLYQAHDYETFFEDINHPDGYRMWLNTKDLLGSIEAPGVETWCLVGVGQKTLGRLEYLGDFPYSPSIEMFDDGDGTVSIQSAKYCKNWSKQQEQPVFFKEFQANHMEMLKDSRVLRYIEEILENNSERNNIS